VTISAIDETMLANLFRTMRALPSNHHKTPAHAAMSLEKIAAGNKGKGLSSATTNRHMRFLKVVFDWASKRVPGCAVVDWSAFVVADKRVKRDKRAAFSVRELETLFTGAIWHGSESKVRRLKPGQHVWHDSAYWIPILLTYTGARREEIAKIMVDDVAMIEGIWALKVRVTETGRVKTESSVRDIPLANEVIRLGFLKFVEHQRKAGQVAVFADLGSGASNYGDAFYKKWWRSFIRAGLVPDAKDMHSIRHFVATELANLDVSEERRADLLGHTITSSETARTYTKATRLQIMKQVVDTIPKVTKRLTPKPINLY
jgi:integrase